MQTCDTDMSKPEKAFIFSNTKAAALAAAVSAGAVAGVPASEPLILA